MIDITWNAQKNIFLIYIYTHKYIYNMLIVIFSGQGRRIGGGGGVVPLPISSHYQNVTSNNFDQTIKYMYIYLSFRWHLKRIIDIT